MDVRPEIRGSHNSLAYAIMLAKTPNLCYVDKIGAVWGCAGIVWVYLNEIYPLCSDLGFLPLSGIRPVISRSIVSSVSVKP